jgi:hypothetical protein
MFSLKEEQYTLYQSQVYTAGWTDWGTFTNNYYFNPFEEQSIHVLDHFNGGHWRYNLERWQNDLGEDGTSFESPQRRTEYEVTGEITGNLIPNGTFDANVNGWTGWPYEAQITHDYSYLDNGAMKILFNDNTSYNTFTHYHTPDFQVYNGAWYRATFSMQSDMIGELKYGLKGSSQVTGPQTIYSRHMPFGTDRREVEVIFQSDLTDQAHFQFTNHYTESTYWLDNLEMHEVAVVPADPFDSYQLLYNEQNTTQTFNLIGCWSDVQGNLYSGTVDVAPWESIVLIKEPDIACGLTTGVEDIVEGSAEAFVVHPNPTTVGNMLYFSSIEEEAIARIFDINGRLLSEQNLAVGASSVDLDDTIARGSYVLRITSATADRSAHFTVQ